MSTAEKKAQFLLEEAHTLLAIRLHDDLTGCDGLAKRVRDLRRSYTMEEINDAIKRSGEITAEEFSIPGKKFGPETLAKLPFHVK